MKVDPNVCPYSVLVFVVAVVVLLPREFQVLEWEVNGVRSSNTGFLATVVAPLKVEAFSNHLCFRCIVRKQGHRFYIMGVAPSMSTGSPES